MWCVMVCLLTGSIIIEIIWNWYNWDSWANNIALNLPWLMWLDVLFLYSVDHNKIVMVSNICI